MPKLYARLAPSDSYVDIDVYLDFENEAREGYLNVLGVDRYTASYLSPDWKMLSSTVSTAAYYLDNLGANDFECYDRARDVLDDYFPGWEGNKKKSSRLIHEWKEAILDCADKMEEDAACRLLTLWTGKKHVWRSIRGCSQGDYAEIYFPSCGSAEKDDKYRNEIEAYYFNLGAEVEIHDGENEPNEADEINGYWQYIPISYPNADEIKAYIAEMEGISPEDVVLYVPTEEHVHRSWEYEIA